MCGVGWKKKGGTTEFIISYLRAGGVVIPTRFEAAFVGADGVEEPPYLRLAVLRVEAE